jgi:hypothetical protein
VYSKVFKQANLWTRRNMLARCGMGVGALGLASLFDDAGLLSTAQAADRMNPLASRNAPLPAKAKRVIHLFMNGGPSHIDTFDPKPALKKYAGRMLPTASLKTERKTGVALPSPFRFKKYGKSGIEVSELFPHVGAFIDDIAVVRSMVADLPNHEPSLMLMNCGDGVMVRPSVGSWLTYGLGTENQNLPGFVALCPGGYPVKESENWRAGFLPGVYQGTFVDTQHTEIDMLIEHIRNHRIPIEAQREQLDLVQQLNAEHRQSRGHDEQLDARIQSFELAYRMQMEAADAFDLSSEPQHVLNAYGSSVQARQLLIARRLSERGVRFVQVWHGAGQPWDSHEDIMQHKDRAAECDVAIAALLADLKQRGLLNETLVLWGGEFGRTPTAELPQAKGRDHNPYGFTVWMAGGGVRGGYVHGATDEFGFRAVENRVHVHDLHATMLRLLGFDHEKFTYRYAGRDFRLTNVQGRVIEELIA